MGVVSVEAPSTERHGPATYRAVARATLRSLRHDPRVEPMSTASPLLCSNNPPTMTVQLVKADTVLLPTLSLASLFDGRWGTNQQDHQRFTRSGVDNEDGSYTVVEIADVQGMRRP